jgi:asparagine synthase (glutamine-hydrolysing)
MCGFAGFIPDDEKRDNAKIVRAMGKRIAHRGPDDDQIYVDDDIALCFRRLSIIDLKGGVQPMWNEDNTVVVIFNGEIYNFMELRDDLIAKGHVFKTKADTEVLVHGYEEWGKDMLNKLRGMFAFVIFDKKTNKLFGARDIFGIKPFYYYRKNGEFMFGSEIKSFLEHPAFEKEVNFERIPDYMSFEYVPCDETVFKYVYKLPAAHFFEYENGTLKIQRYYKIHYSPDESKSLADWEEMIQSEFEESVHVHQIADVKVGCFLSSGVDSSYTLKEVSKVMKDVNSFSVGYEEKKYSELPFAQEFSEHIGVKNISNLVSADDYFNYAAKIQYYMDEPLPNPSEVPLFFLAKNARQYVKVVLSGEGADELFGGYPMYLQGGHFMKYCKIPLPLRKAAANFAKSHPGVKGHNFMIHGAMKPYERYMRNNYVFPYGERDNYLLDDIKSCNPADYTKIYFDETADLDEVTSLQYADINTWMQYDILQKADRMSMANSLELRVPFLDRKMLELAVTIPTKYRIDGDTTKVALRATAMKQLPEKNAERKKLGFPVPLSDWLCEDKYYNMVKEAFNTDTAGLFFKKDAINKLLDDHKNGVHKDMTKVWTVYSLILWYDEFFKNEAASVAE